MKRARYDGPHPAVEAWPNGYTGPSVIVEQGKFLPAEDSNGDPIPAVFRDSLLEQADIWSEVKQAKPAAKKAAAKPTGEGVQR